jgi:hypothetical protein
MAATSFALGLVVLAVFVFAVVVSVVAVLATQQPNDPG